MSAGAFFAPRADELIRSAELRAFHGVEVRTDRWVKRGQGSLSFSILRVHPLDAITIACEGDPHAELERAKAWRVQNAHHRLDTITDRLADDSLLDQDIIDEVEGQQLARFVTEALGISLTHWQHDFVAGYRKFEQQGLLHHAWSLDHWRNPLEPWHHHHDTGKAADL